MPSKTASARLLVVDDEPDLLTLYELTLLREGHAVDTAATLGDARTLLRAGRYDVLITDMRLPDGSGMDLIRELAAQGRTERAMVVTAFGSAENAVEALKQGAFDYLTKPVDLKQLRHAVATALQDRQAGLSSPGTQAVSSAPSADATPPAGLHDQRALALLVGQSDAMAQVKQRIVKVATSMAPVMILGESGTGKEVVARAIHACSHRSAGPFVAVNCGAIPDTLIEAEFFGARKGAYTGAVADREGYFSAARGGTLFLDEIGDLPLAMQAKLLRAIQERRVRPLGGVQEEAVDVRILCATHKDLGAAVAAGEFRQDLFYRLNVIEIKLPPLRERRDDLIHLVQALMQRICAESGQQAVALSPQAWQWLQQHPFAGNVRELENLLHRALALCNGETIQPDDLQDTPGLPCATAPASPASSASPSALNPVADASPATAATDAPPAEADTTGWPTDFLPTDLQQHLDEHEKAILERVLKETRGNRTAAAAKLGLNLRQIRYRIARLGIQVNDRDDDGPTA